MRIRWTRTITASLLALPVLLTVATANPGTHDTAPGPEAMPVDLTGVWNLDEYASVDFQAELELLMKHLRLQRDQANRGDSGGPSSKHGTGGGGGHGNLGTMDNRHQSGHGSSMGNPGDNAHGGHGGHGGQDGDPGEAPRDLINALDQLLITINGADVEIMDGTDQTRIWTPGAGPVSREGQGGSVMDQAWWEDDVLVLATTGGQLGVTRRLHLAGGGRTLVAEFTVTVPGTSQSLEARMVYAGY